MDHIPLHLDPISAVCTWMLKAWVPKLFAPWSVMPTSANPLVLQCLSGLLFLEHTWGFDQVGPTQIPPIKRKVCRLLKQSSHGRIQAAVPFAPTPPPFHGCYHQPGDQRFRHRPSHGGLGILDPKRFYFAPSLPLRLPPPGRQSRFPSLLVPHTR